MSDDEARARTQEDDYRRRANGEWFMNERITKIGKSTHKVGNEIFFSILLTRNKGKEAPIGRDRIFFIRGC